MTLARDVPLSAAPGRLPRVGDPGVRRTMRALSTAASGAAGCGPHHAAFDRFFFAIRPDYVIEVRPSVLRESDGPMLLVGLQQINGQLIHLPRRAIDLPDRARLERRYEQFRQAAG